MNWGGISTVFGVATIKFMFAPIGGPPLQLSFLETWVGCCAGAIISSAIFYFSASFFMKRSIDKAEKKNQDLIAKGLPIPFKKKFTRMNKLVVRMKGSLGIIGISFWAPFFLSIPLGSIVTAKFYGDNNKTYPLIVLGIFLNGLAMTGIAFLFFA
jgi:hypothetical protein